MSQKQVHKSETAPFAHYTLFGALALSAAMLAVQQPFAYFASDNVFHFAKVMLATRGEFALDPVVDVPSLYPPLFAMIGALFSKLFGLSTFVFARLIQIIDFVGAMALVYVLCRVTLRDAELAAWGALAYPLLLFGPTGKYFFYPNPSNFGLLFLLGGVALALLHLRRPSLVRALTGGAALGLSTVIWWWYAIPLVGLAIGFAAHAAVSRYTLRDFKAIAPIAAAALVPLLINLILVLQVQSDIGGAAYSHSEHSSSAGLSVFESVRTWVVTFLLKGNQPFLKHLIPEVLSVNSSVRLLYGVVGSIYFYLIALPFNYALVWLSLRQAWTARVRSARDTATRSDFGTILSVAALTTLALSFAATVLSNVATVRRIHFVCLILLLPGFIEWLRRHLPQSVRVSTRKLLPAAALALCAFTTVYSFAPQLTDPLSTETKDAARFIETALAEKPGRVFIRDFDARILYHETVFPSYVLYATEDANRVRRRAFGPAGQALADSLYRAYTATLSCHGEWERELMATGARFAVVSSVKMNQSPVVSKESANPGGAELMACFRERYEIIYENAEWTIFALGK